MDLAGTVYEAGNFRLYEPEFRILDKFMSDPNEDSPLHDGDTSMDVSPDEIESPGRGKGKENNYVKGKLKKGEGEKKNPILQVFEVEDGVWALCLENDPEVCICQIDHNNFTLREGNSHHSGFTLTVWNYVKDLFTERFEPQISKPKNAKEKKQGSENTGNYDYSTNKDLIKFTPSTMIANKYIKKLDLSQWLKV